MRLKKQKRHRKVVRFYSAFFGFREPYKVLCDGTFIHHLILHDLTPADDSLSNLLGARVILLTSRCVIGELTSFGESYALAVEASRQIITAVCDHEKSNLRIVWWFQVGAKSKHLTNLHAKALILTRERRSWFPALPHTALLLY